MKLIEARNLFRTTLKGKYPLEEVDYYFKMILSPLFDLNPISIALEPNISISLNQQKKLDSVLHDLLLERPIQYIVGEVPFRKLNLKVNDSVLIPRPETEELVEWILEDHLKTAQKLKVIDLGTGSGCIALSLKKEQPLFEVYGLDLDEDILDLALQNAQKNNLQVAFLKQDMRTLQKFKFKVDLIVSNPPYISTVEKKQMKENVLNYEPHQALFVPDEDPLFFYRKILIFAAENLSSKGRIYFEINPLFETAMEDLIFSFECYSVTKRLDIFGKNRMMRLEKNEYDSRS